MKVIKSLVLYMALAFGANAALADPAGIADLREGDMKKLVVHSEPKPVSATPFNGANGNQMSLNDYKGKVTAVNFWAVWCAPCREEMPMLSELQTEFGGDDFEVVTIAAGRNSPQAMNQFFEEIGVDNLPLHADPRMALSREMGVFGLPVTILLDRDGQEVARLQGDAHWNSESAKNIIRAMIGG